jgi:hypothetical protein
VYRIPVINSLWEQGILFARWLPDLVYGYGSPLFLFYPPLSAYLLTLCYWLVGENVPLAINLFFLLTLIGTAIGIFLAARQLFDNMGGLIATAAYIWSPHVLLQPYSRSSLSTALALALLPWAIYGVLLLGQLVTRRRIVGTAVCIAAIFLSHVASSFLFLGPLLLFGLAVSWLSPQGRIAAVGILLAILLGLGLATFFWLPALTEIQFTRYDTEVDKVNYQDFFAAVWQWPPRPIAGLANAQLPHSAGVLQQGLGLLAGVLAVWNLRRRGTVDNSQDWLTAISVLLGGSVLFLTTPLSDWVWANSTLLQALQFPWRLLDIPTLFLSLACGWWGANDRFHTVTTAPDQRPHYRLALPVVTWRVGIMSGFLLILGNGLPYLYPPRTAMLPSQPTLEDITRIQQTNGIIGLTGWGEYSSESVTVWPAGPASVGADNQATLAQKLLDRGNVQIIESTPWSLTAVLLQPQPLTLSFASHYFPGWTATIDGKETAVFADELGRLTVPLPSRAKDLRIAFEHTPVRWVGDIISSLAFVIAVGMLLPGDTRQSRTAISLTRDDDPFFRLLAVGLLGVLAIKLLWLDQVTNPLVVHPSPTAVPGTTPVPWGDFGDIKLLGAHISPTGELTLYWRAQQQPSWPYEIVVTLLDGRGVPVHTQVNRNPGLNVTTNWEPGQITQDVYMLPIKVVAPPVGYRVQVSVRQPDSDPLPITDAPPGVTTVEVGSIRWLGDRVADIADGTAVDAIFDDSIRLVKANFPSVIATPLLQFDLLWQSVAAVSYDYTVFLHLIDANGNIVSQSDGQPLGGVFPTSFWQPGDRIADQRVWVINAPPGTYRLQLGFYLLATGKRLPVAGSGTLGDRFILGEIEIED